MAGPSDKALSEHIRKAANRKPLPDGSTAPVINLAGALGVSKKSGAPLDRVDIMAARNGVHTARFLRNYRALSIKEQEVLGESRVTVVGLGGLGGVVVEILARIGVGALTLVDGDRFEESNLNRQLMSTVENLGEPKPEAAARRVKAVNPAVKIHVHSGFVDENSVAPLLKDAAVVIDCLDRISARFALEAAAKTADKPMISSAVAGAAGHVATIFPQDAGLTLIYGEAGQAADTGSEIELGCLPQAVFLLASVEASEAVKIILGRNDLLRNRLLLVDLTGNNFEVLQLC
jgi:molybdopterin/thiamine biosynthesis adenylyltransferase